MDSLIASSAGPDEIDVYTEGLCHAFALALHRRLGWDLIVVTDPENPCWEDPADADNAIPNVTHVLARDPSGMAWDVLGCRPEADVEAEILDRHPATGGADAELVTCEAGLAAYVSGPADEEDGVDRPLRAVTDADVDAAWETAARVLDGLPGFDAPAPGPR